MVNGGTMGANSAARKRFQPVDFRESGGRRSESSTVRVAMPVSIPANSRFLTAALRRFGMTSPSSIQSSQRPATGSEPYGRFCQ
jgi:hypothetical protein